MIYCPKCGTANRQGSKFCNECGSPLPATGLRCPMCGAMNPTGNLYCDRCHARLIPAERVPPEEEKPERPSPLKGISLPSVPLAEGGAGEEWLAELRAEAEEVGPSLEAAGVAPLPEGEIPPWLAELTTPAGPVAPEAPPPAAVPEWLMELEVPAGPAAPEAPPLEAAVPDWLTELTAPAGPAAPEAPPLEAAVPDWLTELTAPAGPAAPEAPPPAAAVPEWLAELEVPAGPAAPEAPPLEAAVPEWLTELTAPAGPDAPEALPPAAAVPEWLAELEVPSRPSPEAPVPPLAGIPVPPPDEIPDWLREIQAAPLVQEGPSAKLPPIALVDVPTDAPAAPESVPPVLLEEETPIPAPGEIPDWLKAASEKAPPEFGGLVPAEIPEWLRALQPRAEAVVEEEPAETAGFLAGLRGLLPIGYGLDMPADARPSLPKPPSPAAVARAELLQGLLSRPLIAPPTTAAREVHRPTGWALTRFLVGAILLGAILLPMLIRLPLFGPPVAPTVEALFAIVNQLPSSTPVLVAWEYGPAEAEEMDRVAGPLIDHLLRREARLVLVSTRPEGPAVAEALLASRLADLSERPRRVANLGYVPGQAAGVREVLGNLDGRTEISTGLPASQAEAMAGVRSVSDVGMVVVLAAQPDDLRVWVEQVSAARPDVPIVAGVSARAELMSTPYLSGGQIRGMVAGLTGGAAYEEKLDTGWGREYAYYLNSLGLAQVAVAALAVIGALIFLVGGRKR